MTIKTDEVDAYLMARGYKEIHRTKSKKGLQRDGGLPVYINFKNKSGTSALIAHPESGIDKLRDQITDVQIGDRFYHSSNMKGYPKRMHTGKHSIAYGWPMTFSSVTALKAVIDYLEARTSEPSTSVIRR